MASILIFSKSCLLSKPFSHTLSLHIRTRSQSPDPGLEVGAVLKDDAQSPSEDFWGSVIHLACL